MKRERTITDKINTKTKTWLKHHDPEYIKERKKYAADPVIKARRNILSRRRRASSAAAVCTLKKFGPLTDPQGNTYQWTNGCVCKNKKEVVRRARNGVIHFLPYENEEELKDTKFDAPIITEEDKKLYQSVKKLFEGDESIESVVKKTKKVIIKELTDEDCFWKSLDETQKSKILEKLKPNNKIKT
jgi:hypothetical protein